MRKVFNTAWVLLVAVLLYTATAYSDTVWLQNGDRLVGSVQDDYFAIQAPYGQIVIKNSFLKALTIADAPLPDGRFHTVNNDIFSGHLLNKNIRIHLENNTAKILDMPDIKEILFDIDSMRRPVVTTVFTMTNNDRFSGQLLNDRIELRTAGSILAYTRQQLNRLEFAKDPTGDVSLLSTSGDLVHGQLLLERLRIAPDSIARLTVNKSDLKAIQFNARKLLSKDYRKLPPADKDVDGDGVPDTADACDDTMWDAAVDHNGCSKQPAPEQTLTAKTQGETVDTDGDGVTDELDQCRDTPPGAEVEATGCPVIADILFDFDSAQIKPRYYPILGGLIAILKANPALKIAISGHTDNVGPEKYNQALSEQRARMVKLYITERGVAAQRITARGYGSARYAASNENAAGRALNRRAVVGWTR